MCKSLKYLGQVLITMFWCMKYLDLGGYYLTDKLRTSSLFFFLGLVMLRSGDSCTALPPSREEEQNINQGEGFYTPLPLPQLVVISIEKGQNQSEMKWNQNQSDGWPLQLEIGVRVSTGWLCCMTRWFDEMTKRSFSANDEEEMQDTWCGCSAPGIGRWQNSDCGG